MTYDSTTRSDITRAGSRRTITAFFDSRQDANEAVERLVRAGIQRGSISLVEGANRTQGASVSRDDEGPGFWEALKDLFLPDEDRATYAEGLRRGGYIVYVQASDALYEKAIDILDDEGTVDLDQRAQSWRQEGWTGTGGSDYSRGTTGARSSGAIGAAASTTTGLGTGGTTAGLGTTAGRPAAGTAGTGAAATARSAATGREEVIPVAEEQLHVGKRDVSHGRVRIRSYVVETPVQEQVNLRQEHVSVERRAADRPVTGADNLFRERTIEAEERAEEAVVSKEARVKEELVVKKDVDQRSQTVSDKVRRTEVEVDDERGNALRSGERNKR
jgi:uncharacterized protein (TIGR02271 family)